MEINNQFSIYVGTVRGVLGHTSCKSDECPKFELNTGHPGEITTLEWGDADDIIIGYKDGNVKLYDTLASKYKNVAISTTGTGAVVGTHVIGNNLIIARKSGHINTYSNQMNNVFDIGLSDKGILNSAVHNKNRPNIIGTGGECNDFKLWDLETQKCIFKAKSMGHDELNLPLPTSVRDICFFPSDEKLNACVTKEGYVLLYDERAQRRPVAKYVETKASFTTITPYRERQCVVGTTKGYMQVIDLKTPSKCIKTFKSFSGCITSIVCDPVKPVIFSTCLDRFLRIHNMETKELLRKEYMKQSLTKLIMKPILKEEVKDEEITKNIDGEYEQLFDGMEVITDKRYTEEKKRKHLDVSSAKTSKKSKRNKLSHV